jgi:hypothetical protein
MYSHWFAELGRVFRIKGALTVGPLFRGYVYLLKRSFV